MSRALTLKYRPKTFEEVVGQNITATILKRVVEMRSFKNCYLFAGHSGCGKTTLARIFANEINGGVGDPIEIDGASNGGIEEIRAIIESANERSLTGEYKVFIIDECHAITSQGWQAFLKGIEEPPKYTVFVFCTTEPHKVPATILNRVQRYNISPIAPNEIKDRLLRICELEGFLNYEDTCDVISKTCNGGMRDAITLLDQCADYSTDLRLENSTKVIGSLSYDNIFDLTRYIVNKDVASALSVLDGYVKSGTNLKTFVDQYMSFCLDLSKYCLFKSVSVTGIPQHLEQRCAGFAGMPGAVDVSNKLVDDMLELKSLIQYSTSADLTVQAYFVRMMRG